MKKKRNKNNKVYLFILCIILFLSVFFVAKTLYSDNDNENKESNEIKDKETNKEKEKEKEKKEDNNIYKVLNYYKEDNLKRYIDYNSKHKDYDIEKVVTYVNIGLDKAFYTNVKDADTSKQNLLLMNKYNKLKSDYEPNDLEEIDSKYFINGNTLVRKLRKDAKEAFIMLAKDALENGTPVYGQSGYRPYEMQKSLYDDAVASYGKASADEDTARPGFSEHQTGLAIDVSSTKGGNMLSFHKTKSFKWMNENAYKYGFILRYPDDKTNITGFMYESWHYRFVGVDVATDMHNNYSDLTYEEYYVKFLDK